MYVILSGGASSKDSLLEDDSFCKAVSGMKVESSA